MSAPDFDALTASDFGFNFRPIMVDEQAMVDEGVESVTAAMGGDWEPREGTPEVILLEALSVIAGQVVLSFNEVAPSIVEQLLSIIGLYRDPGLPATGTVTLTVSNLDGNTLPAGLALTAATFDGNGVVDLVSTTPLVIPAGSLTGLVAVTTLGVGTTGNGLPAGTRLTVSDAVPFIERAELASPLLAGRDSESDEQLYARGSQRFARLTSTLVNAASFEIAAVEVPGITRAHTIDRYLPPLGIPGSDLGHVAVAVCDPAGHPVAADAKTSLEQTLTAMGQAGLGVHVIDAIYTTVAVSAQVQADLSVSDEAALADACVQALTLALSPLVWAWDTQVSRLNLAGILAGVDGVRRIVNVTVPAVDLNLTGPAALTLPGTITVTVVPG